jgi:hypothetical protein
MAKMRIYTVHINPRKKHPYENPVFIEEAFNWYAFLFRPFWALSHRLWLVAAVLFVLLGFVEFAAITGIVQLHIAALLNLFIMVVVGFHGNDWRRNKLRKQGYIISDIVTGSDLVGAEQRYFERYYPHGRLPQTPPHNPPSTPGSKQGLPLPA